MEIEILNPERLRFWGERINLPAEALEDLQQIAGLVNADGALAQVLSDFYIKTSLNGEWMRAWEPLPFDPIVQGALGERASMFYVLAYLARLPGLDQEYQRRGITETIFFDTMHDFRRYLLEYRDIHGYWGYDKFTWIWRHLDMELFRLGRLQFMLLPFQDGVRALRNRVDGRTLLLADPDVPLRQDGFAAGAGHRCAERQDPAAIAGAWRPIFEETGQGWRGHPISREGHASCTPAFFSNSQWELWVQRGDWVLDMHIPNQAPLTAEACRDALRQAYAFFPRIFPERPFRAGFCHTWFFTTQLQYLLPLDSAILAFQRQFHCYPHAGGPEYLWEFVFGEKYPDSASAPRDTSLRRAVLDWLASGGELFDLPGLLLRRPDEWGIGG